MPTLLTILKQAEQFLKKKGVQNALFNVEVLFAHALNCERIDLYLRYNQQLKEDQLAIIRALLSRRAHNEPLQYIVGEWSFYELVLALDHRALIPRQETEYLVEHGIKYFREKRFYNPHILDLGTGSGAIGLSFAKEFPRARVVASDRDPNALNLAQKNIQRNRLNNVTLVHSDWFANIEGTFDLIISNPPYLSESEWQETANEVKDHEPRGALVSNDAGKADLSIIIKQSPKFLKMDGFLMVETGPTQHKALLELASDIFLLRESKKDQFGRDRFLIFRQPKK